MCQKEEIDHAQLTTNVESENHKGRSSQHIKKLDNKP